MEREPESDPEAELRQRIQERHGDTFDVGNVVQCVRRKLNSNGVNWAEYLSADSKRTTPRSVKSAAWYISLAKTLGHEATEAAMRDRARVMDAIMAPKHEWRPPVCEHGCNDGRLPNGGSCTCSVGVLRAQMEQLRMQRENAA